MNVIARLEYELAYYDSAVHRFNHYTPGWDWVLCLIAYQPLRVLCRGKEKIHSEIESIIYLLVRLVLFTGSTSIISLALLVLRPKLVLQLTDVLQSYLSAFLSASTSPSPCLRDTASFILSQYRKSHGTSHYTTVGYLFNTCHSYRRTVVILFNSLLRKLREHTIPKGISVIQFRYW